MGRESVRPRTSPSCNSYNADGLQVLQKRRLIHEVTGRPRRQPNLIGPCPVRTSGVLANSCRQEMLHWHTSCFELFRNEQSSTRTHGEVIRPEPRFSNYLPARGRRATLRLRPTSTFMPTQAGTLPATSRPLAFFGPNAILELASRSRYRALKSWSHNAICVRVEEALCR